MGEVTNLGIDAYANWADNIGHCLSYSAGVNFTWSKNRIDKIDEGPEIEAYRSRIGKPTSTNITWRYAGMFGPAENGMVDVTNHPFQSFGQVQAGDLAYKDINSDYVVDGRDQEMIGQTLPLTVWGLDVKLNYKGFGMYVLGTAETCVQKLATTKYFFNYGEDGYSILARDAYHPERNPAGTRRVYPHPPTSATIGVIRSSGTGTAVSSGSKTSNSATRSRAATPSLTILRCSFAEPTCSWCRRSKASIPNDCLPVSTIIRCTGLSQEEYPLHSKIQRMKKRAEILFVCLSGFTVVSCNGLLYMKKDATCDDHYTWNIKEALIAPLNKAYSGNPALPDNFGEAFLDAATDKAIATNKTSSAWLAGNGGISKTSPAIGNWYLCYNMFQYIHEFMRKGLADDVAYYPSNADQNVAIKRRVGISTPSAFRRTRRRR